MVANQDIGGLELIGEFLNESLGQSRDLKTHSNIQAAQQKMGLLMDLLPSFKKDFVISQTLQTIKDIPTHSKDQESVLTKDSLLVFLVDFSEGILDTAITLQVWPVFHTFLTEVSSGVPDDNRNELFLHLR